MIESFAKEQLVGLLDPSVPRDGQRENLKGRAGLKSSPGEVAKQSTKETCLKEERASSQERTEGLVRNESKEGDATA